ncbi:MAG: hypothetical protein IJF73_04855 [Clostridia bacterium]|nr:hypothetical protein [Clostridia bacterium]
MSQNKFEIFDEARDFMARTRPIFVEHHDFSAKLFRDKEATEPCFSFAAKGENRFDIYKILGGVLLFFVSLCSLRIYFSVKKARRRRKKELRRMAKQKA